jgi:hypothetical protein
LFVSRENTKISMLESIEGQINRGNFVVVKAKFTEIFGHC